MVEDRILAIPVDYSSLGCLLRFIKIINIYDLKKQKELILFINKIEGWLGESQQILLSCIASQITGHIAEIGVFKGKTTAVFCSAAFRDEIVIHAIDKFSHEGLKGIKEEFLTNIYNLGYKDRVCLHEGDSSAVAAQFEDSFFDFVYIDGDHSAPAVRKDIEAYYPKLKPGKLLAGHDYPVNGVDNELRPVVDELVKNNNRFEGFADFSGIWAAIKK
ncbi:MAG: class I SAM-dependent methyltransferase [Nanoarchaeota archaeon]